MPRNALGRGLGALIRELQPKDSPEAAATVQPHATSASGAAATPAREAAYPGPTQIDIDLIEPSPFQPRTRFRPASFPTPGRQKPIDQSQRDYPAIGCSPNRLAISVNRRRAPLARSSARKPLQSSGYCSAGF